MRLKDKIAIVTGGAQGRGEAEARLFAREGAAVVIADVLPELGEGVAAEINAGQGRAMFVRTDVASEVNWRRLIARTIETYGRLEILVNNAGISGSSVGSDLSLEGWNRLMSIMRPACSWARRWRPRKWPRPEGSIVNISSIMGFVGGAEGHPGLIGLERRGPAS